MKKIVFFIATLGFFFAIKSINSYANDLDVVKKNGILKIAVDSTYPPMEFEDSSGKVVGLDIDLALKIAEVMKVKAEFIVMPWDGILAGLQSNRYDVIMSSMNITDERKQQVNFVPYLQMGQVFVIKKSAPPIKNEQELALKVVAVQADTTSHTAVEKFKNSNIAIKEIKAFKGATETFAAIKSNQADVIVIDEAVGLYYAALDPKTFIVSGEALKPEPMGIAINKKNEKLLKEITVALKIIKNNGTFNRIYKQWLNTTPKF